MVPQRSTRHSAVQLDGVSAGADGYPASARHAGERSVEQLGRVDALWHSLGRLEGDGDGEGVKMVRRAATRLWRGQSRCAIKQARWAEIGSSACVRDIVKGSREILTRA